MTAAEFTVNDLRSRPAGYEVISECLTRQAQRSPRSPMARFFGFSPIHADDASWFTGALGEQAVGRQLARLGPEWTVLHAIPVGIGDSDIDHLLIGPPGVFTLNTKRHRGKKLWVGDQRILVAGQKVDHLRNSRHEAVRASKLLSRARGRTVEVSAALVFVAVQEITMRSRPRDVHIWTERTLVRRLGRLKPRLQANEMDAIIHVAVRESTWSDKPGLAVRSAIFADFDALVREESSALRVRRMWALGMAMAALAVLVPIVISALG